VWLTRWLRDFVYDLRLRHGLFVAVHRLPPPHSYRWRSALEHHAIYSLVDQLLLHALPVRQPERLVLIDWKEIRRPPASARESDVMPRFAATFNCRSASSTVFSAVPPRP
jgi:hypothetical protein